MLMKNELTHSTQRSDLSTNVDVEEIKKFDALAREWRDPKGKFSSVLEFNRVRLEYITSQITKHFGNRRIRILDVGCGAGLLTQPLAEQGHDVLGIDASETNIRVANEHGKSLENLEYRHVLSTTLIDEPTRFDLVLNTEVLEHVPHPDRLLRECAGLIASDGMMILATINRTILSFVVAIVGAEYVIRALPIGTHKWRAFVTPKEIQDALTPLDLTIGKTQGMKYNPITHQWGFSNSSKVNFLVSVLK
ncbi:bifunctional 2-polyprenyl-6-hydroxyphenol methylase/3-demethylubiquinol 3-O-methyltransferase UbiG [uncultured Vibrio sp.]|uniref:bifunctional 2-polyprenyl-6-hydroxyphenol methylase/3-demethylubiquinol 3-O-methyltransferase UbiG n=1 Tax=uncultured Vibrio sp. TaxID=114054 RepID=UPI0025ED591F|nr:bifunctional 2-polyprenyl-6-hydroxyphenol methylase/3-demethylubiquinol 3-O-methyltransferase UbiG [uncultured Vibrio sp.]